MWPFRKKTKSVEDHQYLPQRPIIDGDDIARYCVNTDRWEFEINNTNFILNGKDFVPEAFSWARSILSDVKRLDPEINLLVALGVSCRPSEAKSKTIWDVTLDDYNEKRHVELDFDVDEYGIHSITMEEGEIVKE